MPFAHATPLSAVIDREKDAGARQFHIPLCPVGGDFKGSGICVAAKFNLFILREATNWRR